MNKDIAEKWYKQALHDLEMAEKNISIQGYDISAFKKDALPKIFNKIKPEKILLFGSQATGKATENSDIDIIIISDFFKNMPFLERMPFVLKLIQFPKHVDIICYSREEFQKMKDKSSILIDALKNGKELMITA